MKQPLRTEAFNADFDEHYEWYLEQAGEKVAKSFLDAMLITLRLLAAQPDLGRQRKFRHPALCDLRSIQLKRPFNRILIFYRMTDDRIMAWRLMHGARDLDRRLADPRL